MRLIDADRLLSKLEKRRKYLREPLGDSFVGAISIMESEHVSEVVKKMAQESVDPVKHGRWISRDPDDCCVWCDACNEYFALPVEVEYCKPVADMGFNYCPYCGAKMDEVSE